jgi:amidase
LSYTGVQVSTEGQEHVPSAVGPITRSLSSLIVVMQNMLDSAPWLLDPKVVPIPWRQQIFEDIQSRPLTIGILLDDGVVKVHPPIERVLKDLERKLRLAGHEIVQWEGTEHQDGINIMVSWQYPLVDRS